MSPSHKRRAKWRRQNDLRGQVTEEAVCRALSQPAGPGNPLPPWYTGKWWRATRAEDRASVDVHLLVILRAADERPHWREFDIQVNVKSSFAGVVSHVGTPATRKRALQRRAPILAIAVESAKADAEIRRDFLRAIAEDRQFAEWRAQNGYVLASSISEEEVKRRARNSVVESIRAGRLLNLADARRALETIAADVINDNADPDRRALLRGAVRSLWKDERIIDEAATWQRRVQDAADKLQRQALRKTSREVTPAEAASAIGLIFGEGYKRLVAEFPMLASTATRQSILKGAARALRVWAQGHVKARRAAS